MKTNTKILLLLVALIASMYYWITGTLDGMQRIISMLVLVILAYLLGRSHQEKIKSGEIRAIGEGVERPSPYIQNG